MEIEIEGRRMVIQLNWSRPKLQDQLLKSALTLTKVDADAGQNVTPTHSLAVCLLQHGLNRYSDLRRLGEAWRSTKSCGINCDEGDWIRFCQHLDKKNQEAELELKNEKITKKASEEVTPRSSTVNLQRIIKGVVDTLDQFQWLGLLNTSSSFRVGCIVGEDYVIDIRPKIYESAESICRHQYVWYDSDSQTFHGIAKWMDTFQDRQAYRVALSCQVAQNLKDFCCCLLKKGNPGDDELEMRSMAYLKELNQQLDRNIEDHLAMVDRWDEDSEESSKLKILLHELLDPSFDEHRFEINLELRQEFIESLEKAYGEVQILRQEAYEKARLQAIQNREEDERKERQFKLEIETATVEIQRLEQEIEVDERSAQQQFGDRTEQMKKARYRDLWRTARYKVLETSNRKKPLRFIGAVQVLIMQKRELLKSKTEQLEWDRFRLLLHGLPPPLEIAKHGRNHKLFAIDTDDTADALLTDVLEELKLLELFEKQGGNSQLLMSYARQNSSKVLAEIRRILDKMVTEPINSMSNQTWRFSGCALLLSHIYNQWMTKNSSSSEHRCEEITIEASRVIYIDMDWKTPGLSLALSSPRIEAVGTGIRREIDLSGEDAKQTIPEKANDGRDAGLSGDDGEHGAAGQSAGHLSINCDTYLGMQLVIHARGGNGSNGQNGGDGKTGINGQNGRDGELQPKEKVNQDFDFIPLRYYWNFPKSVYQYYSGKIYNTGHLVPGEPGTPGKSGGSAGSGGCGGQGGFAGEVEVECGTGRNRIAIAQNKNGKDGMDGKPGKSAKGGEGGRNGLDSARVFATDSDSLDPWFWVAGKWHEAKGKLKIERIMRESNQSEQIGSRIIVVAQDSGRATDGERGEDGQDADQSHQKKSTPKRAMVEAGASWRSDAAATALASSRLQQKEAAIQKLGAAITNSSEAARRARAAAKQQEANEKKLKQMKEGEQRMRKAFQLAKTQSTSQLMRTTQRTHTIATHQAAGAGESSISLKENDEFIPNTAHVLAKTQPATQSEWAAMNGVDVLDALIAKYSKISNESSRTLSILTQSIVLQIYLPEPADRGLVWSSIAKITRRIDGHPDHMIQSLRCISQDIDLIQELISAKGGILLKPMSDVILKKTNDMARDIVTTPENALDVLGVLYAFRQLSWSYEELQKLLGPLEDNEMSKSFGSLLGKSNKGSSAPDPAKSKLIQFVREKLIYSVAEMMTTATSVRGGNKEHPDETMIQSQVLTLNGLLQCCSLHLTTPDGVPVATFFDKLMEKLKNISGKEGKTGDDVNVALTDFACRQIGIDKVRDLMPISNTASSVSPANQMALNVDDEQRLEKLRFLLSHTKVDVDDLDAIRSDVEKRKTFHKEPYKTIYSLAEQAFVNFYWTREWESYYDFLKEIKENQNRPDESPSEMLDKEELHGQLNELQNVVERLKAALMWTHSGKSYKEMMEVCTNLKEKLDTSGWKDKFSAAWAKLKRSSDEKETPWVKCINWAREQERNIVGFFEDSHKDLPETNSKDFMSFVFRLQTIRQPSKSDKESMVPQFRKALHYLDHNKRVPFTVSEMELFNKVFSKTNEGIFKDETILRDQAKLKNEYVERYADHHFLRWIDSYEEIALIQEEISRQWESCSTDSDKASQQAKVARRKNILLNRYAALTTFFLSPQKCHEAWRSLMREMKVDELDQQLRTRVSNTFGNRIQQMIGDVEAALNQIKEGDNVQSDGIPEDGGGETLCTETKRCLSIVDTLLTSSNCLLVKKELSSTISTILSDVLLLFEYLVELDDTNAERITPYLEKWRTSLATITMEETGNLLKLSADVRRGVANVLDIANWSTTSDDRLLETLNHRTKQNRENMTNALQRQKTFIELLTRERLMDDVLSVVKASVDCLGEGEDLNPSSLCCHKNHNLPLLIQKQVDIWNKCTPSEFHSNGKDALAFLDALLSSTPKKLLKARASLASELLVHHIDTPENVDVLERWTKRINNFVVTFGTNMDSDEEMASRVIELQASLIAHFHVFQTRNLSLFEEANKLHAKINSKIVTEQLTVLARVLGKSKTESNCLLVTSLCHFVSILSKCATTSQRLIASDCIIEIIEQLFRDPNVKKNNVKMKTILDVVYFSSEGFTFTEKSYLERFIQTESCCKDNNMIMRLYNKISDTRKGEEGNISSSVTNRLIEAIDFQSLLTQEERKYLTLLANDEVVERVLKILPPTAYLDSLKERATNQIYRRLILHFYGEEDGDLTDLLESYKAAKKTGDGEEATEQQENSPSDCKLRIVSQFQKSFGRAYFFVKRDGIEFEWLAWLQETVLKSLQSMRRDLLTLANVTQLISASAEFKLDELFQSTVTARPYQWLDNLLANSILKAVDKLDPAKTGNQAERKTQRRHLTSDLHECLRSPQLQGRIVLEVFRRKLEQETRLVAAMESVDFSYAAGLVSGLKTLTKIDDVGRFQGTSLKHWPRLIRHCKLTEIWPSGLANQLVTILDHRLGQDKADCFLQHFETKYGHVQNESLHPEENDWPASQLIIQLEGIVKNLSKYPWIVDSFFALVRSTDVANSEDEDYHWQHIQSREFIEQERSKASQSNLSVAELLRSMRNDPENEAVIGQMTKQNSFVQTIDAIKLLATSEPRSQWSQKNIDNWVTNIKECRAEVDLVDFLSVAFRAVQLQMNCQLRDSQMLAILMFVTPSESQRVQRRMAQISTGEGKTLITTLLVIYHVLSNWSNGRRLVDVITSSPVLAVDNVIEMKRFYEVFGVGVQNNCDATCSDDEELRRKRYNTDVVYGDLSSFQRDILLSRFFSDRDITCNREAGAVVVDEVDSMLLDKGENILYLSHKIPEMDDLVQVFVEIWHTVHDPSVTAGDERAQATVYESVKERVENGDIRVPKCLESFVLRYLLVWTRNAFRAKKVTTKDSYKVDDVGDGRGQQIVIMDKETGVEQVQMQWSHGLHQFLQLKHALKLSPISLKAVFMSNVGFFEQRKNAALYGMTGTLGSTAECKLLGDVFRVDFFKMPRFRRRFCLEEDHLLSPERSQWLDNLVGATKAQVDAKRAVLVVCENIASAEAAYNKLLFAYKQEDQSKKGMEATIGVNISKYVSSFDKGFQKKQHDSSLAPGDIIVATNLAGRGTDFKVNEQLAKNGGLHVIIGYMPANARIEAQIEGRVARAGQPGSFQFVVWDPTVSVSKSDVASELCGLKVRRDDRECRRLEQIRTRGLQKIFLEEELFKKFHEEIYNVARKMLRQNTSPDGELQLKFLTNNWALWLDDNADHIDNIHVRKSDTVYANFNSFKTKCLESAGDSAGSFARFASTPSELMTLGDFFEKTKETEHKANHCYIQVVKKEPDDCPGALIRQAKLILREAGSVEKRKAKPLLIRARTLIENKIGQLSICNDLVKKTLKTHEKSGSVMINENRFEEQTTNLISLLQVHLTAIDDILGRSVVGALTMHFPKEEEMQDILALITDELKHKGHCKPHRLSKSVSVRSIGVGKDMSDDHQTVLWMDYGTTSQQRRIHWPTELSQYERAVVQRIDERRDALRQSFTKCTLMDVVVTQNQVWEELVKEGYVVQEKIIDQDVIRWAQSQIEGDSAVKDFLERLPTELNCLKTVLVDWLKRHDEEPFDHAVTPLKLDNVTLKSLESFLKESQIVIHINHRQGVLSKEISFDPNRTSSPVVGLSEQLTKFDHLIAMWILQSSSEELGESAFKKVGEIVSREELPCPKDSKEGAEKIWKYLLSEGVIKEPKVAFAPGLNANKEHIESRRKEITEVVESLAGVKEICWKHRPPPKPVTEHSIYYDVPSYWADSAWNAVRNALNYVNPFGGEKSDNASQATNVDEWLTEKQNKEHLEAYKRDVISALFSSIGQLKTIPMVNTTLNPLSDYFVSDTSRTYPAEEMQSLAGKSFTGVIKLEAHKTWWDYWDRRAFYVAMAGVAQIALGVALATMSGGLLAVVSKTLIAEGVSDIGYAIQAGLTGTFSWGGYLSHKKWSLAMSVATAGLGAYLTKGAAAGRLAAMGFQGKAGLALCWAATKRALAKCGQAVLSTMTSMGVERLLSWLKKFVIENVLKHVKFLISKALWFIFNSLSNALDRIWALLQKMGRSVEDVKQVIDGYLDKAKSSDLYTLWGRRMAGQATSVGGAIGRCFSESKDVLDAEGNNQLFEEEKAQGLDALKKSFKFVGYTEKAIKIVNWIKNGTEILGLITFAPEYVKNVESSLSEEARKLEAGEQEKEAMQQAHQNQESINEEEKEEDQLNADESAETTHATYSVASTTTAESETKVFNEYKQKVKERIEGDVVTYMVDSVTKTWVQPWLQSKIEGLIVSAGQNVLERIGSMWKGSQGDSKMADNQAEENEALNDEEAKKAESEKKAAAAKKEIEDSLGEGNSQKETDENGNTVVQPKEYKDVVTSMGQGQAAGLLQMQMVANATNCTLVIIDKTEEKDFKSDDGQFTITPDGKSEKTIQLIYTKNEDGTNHVSLIGPDGKEMQLPPSMKNADGTPVPPNRCLYEAVAGALGKNVDDLLSQVKKNALNDKMSQYLYDQKVNEALPHMRVGRRREGEPADVFFLVDQDKNIRRVLTTITKKNLRGGSDVTPKAREDLKSERPENEKEDYDCGHLIAFLFGGGGKINDHNLVNMHKSLNRGAYKQLEMMLAKFLNDDKTDNARVDIDISLNEGIKNGNFKSPLNLRFSWRVSVDNKVLSHSSVLFFNNSDILSLVHNQVEYEHRPLYQEIPIYRVNNPRAENPTAEIVLLDGRQEDVGQDDGLTLVRSDKYKPPNQENEQHRRNQILEVNEEEDVPVIRQAQN
uniref:Helicase c-terminal domain containing protein n=2 Tax=Daphnia magna TaxID=35525 RepID=A0A0P6FGI2_9CRUS